MVCACNGELSSRGGLFFQSFFLVSRRLHPLLNVCRYKSMDVSEHTEDDVPRTTCVANFMVRVAITVIGLGTARLGTLTFLCPSSAFGSTALRLLFHWKEQEKNAPQGNQSERIGSELSALSATPTMKPSQKRRDAQRWPILSGTNYAALTSHSSARCRKPVHTWEANKNHASDSPLRTR